MVKVLLLLFLGAVSTMGERTCSESEATKKQKQIKIISTLRTVSHTNAFLQSFTNSRELGMTDQVALCFPVALEVMQILIESNIEIEYQLKENGVLIWKKLYEALNLRCHLATQTDLLLQLLAEQRQNMTFEGAIRSGFIAELQKQEDHLFEEIGKKFREQLFDAVCMFDSRKLNHFLERLDHRSINLKTILPIVMGNDKNNTTLGETKQIYLKYDGQSMMGDRLYLTVPEQSSGEMEYSYSHTLEFNQTEPTNGGFAFISTSEQPEIWNFYFRTTENRYFPLNFGYDDYGYCLKTYNLDRCPNLWISDYPIGLKIARTSGVDRMMIITKECGGFQREGNTVIASPEKDKTFWMSNMFIDDN